MKFKRNTLFLAQAGVIAAVYVVLTAVAAGFDLASGVIQVRFSEALNVLPFFTPAAVPGLIAGCFIANLVTGCALPDIVFGTLATAIGAVFAWKLRKYRFLVPLPAVLSNALIIPFVLRYAYGYLGVIPFLDLQAVTFIDLESILFFAATVGAGELIACYGFGLLLLHALLPVRRAVFGDESVSAGASEQAQ